MVSLNFGAGIYQVYSETIKGKESKNDIAWPNFGDEPIDTAAINYGYLLGRRNINLTFNPLFKISNFSFLLDLAEGWLLFDEYDKKFRESH